MRREGKVSGYIRGRRCSPALREREREQQLQYLRRPDLLPAFDNQWPRVKVSNKPTNASKDSGRCRRPACRGCHFLPVSQALSKTKGRRNKVRQADFAFLADPEWTLPGCPTAPKLRLIGNPYPHTDPHDCFSHCESCDDYNVQHHDLTCFVDGHCAFDDDDDDGASVGTCHLHINADGAGDDYHLHDVCNRIHQTQPQGLEGFSQFLRSSPLSNDLHDDSEWHQVVATDIESDEDEWYLC